MKADLYLGDAVSSVEFVAAPRRGDRVFIGGIIGIVHQVGHDLEKRKLRIVCGDAQYQPANFAEASEEGDEFSGGGATIDLTEDLE
jgi:hypothetical protein